MSYTYNYGKMVDHHPRNMVNSRIHVPEMDCTVSIRVSNRSMPLIERIGLFSYIKRFGLQLEDVIMPEDRPLITQWRKRQMERGRQH